MVARGARDQAESLRKFIEKKERDTKRNEAALSLAAQVTTRSPRISTYFAGDKKSGKSSHVLGVGMGLAVLGKKVLILDADYGLGNIDKLIGLKARHNFHNVLAGKVSLSDAMYIGPSGVRILPVGTPDESDASVVKCDRANLVQDFCRIDNNYDHILIDASTSEAATVKDLAATSHEVNILVTATAKSIAQCYAIIKFIETSTGKRHVNIIPSLVTSEQIAGKIIEAISKVSNSFLCTKVITPGFFPYDANIPFQIKEHSNFTEGVATPIAREMQEMVSKIANMPTGQSKQASIDLFRRFLESKKKEKPAICHQR